jgi:hypothetical protein
VVQGEALARRSGWMNGTRASPTLITTRLWWIRRTRIAICDHRAMDDPVPARRRDPAWRWYALAVAVVVLVLVLELTGVFDRLAP